MWVLRPDLRPLGALLTCCCLAVLCQDKVFVPIRVVENPMSLPHGALMAASPLKARVPPANYSGPAIFAHLVGKCFSLVDGNYRYEVCPFLNVTQHEESSNWNAYRGVIGTWKEWLIRGDRFHGLVMDNGDACAPGKHRRAHVLLSCGGAHRVVSVRETVTCFYLLNFSTPLACPPDSRLVYPVLDPSLRQRWDRAAALRHKDFISDKGYQRQVEQILAASGLTRGPSDGQQSPTACDAEVQPLRQEIRALRKQNRNLKRLLEEARRRARPAH